MAFWDIGNIGNIFGKAGGAANWVNTAMNKITHLQTDDMMAIITVILAVMVIATGLMMMTKKGGGQ